jgi:hypothetical protein
MVVAHPESVQLGSDTETFFARHATDFGALDSLGFVVIREDANRPVHGEHASTGRRVHLAHELRPHVERGTDAPGGSAATP